MTGNLGRLEIASLKQELKLRSGGNDTSETIKGKAVFRQGYTYNDSSMVSQPGLYSRLVKIDQ